MSRFAVLSIFLCCGPAFPVLADGTLADYQRAGDLKKQYSEAPVNAVDTVKWLDSTRFWYRKLIAGGHEFVVMNAVTGEKKPAFDHARLAEALSKITDSPVLPKSLPFLGIQFADNDRTLRLEAPQARWTCTLDDYKCKPAEEKGPRDSALAGAPRLSPDGKWEALIRNYNIYVRPAAPREPGFFLSTDGSEGNSYDLRSIGWSPDSGKLIAVRVRPGYRRKVNYVESSPRDQLQPKLMTIDYAKPGDVLDQEQPVLFDLGARREIPIDNRLFPNPFRISSPKWRKDGRALTFEYNQRGHDKYRVIEIDARTGETRTVIDEEAKTFFCYSAKKFRYDVDDGKEIIWMSERDGWNHLYLYNGSTGTVKNQITRGEWVVRGCDWVDEKRREIWFSASGMNRNEDPYFVHYYRIKFDGTGLTSITRGDANHVVVFSPDHRRYVDTWSRVDMAPISELHDATESRKIVAVEKGDTEAMRRTGWRPPEVFTAKGRDGKTDIWGVIYKPSHFDPAKKYPVLESIYAGPQSSFVPKSFSVYDAKQSVAEIGFIVVQIDGMGTSNRSKAFHDVAWKNLADAGFPDRLLWHRAVAAKYPWYDITRVGIYGTSAGGQSALGGLLFHPEFYKAGAAACGCHDNRMDKIWWNELWMGWPVGPQYVACSNTENASKLRGKLLLIVGEMDTNVDPSSTMQVVNALIKANKTFDLLVIPGSNHGNGGSYGQRKEFDFFVHHLMGVEPPDWNANAALAILLDSSEDLGTAPSHDEAFE